MKFQRTFLVRTTEEQHKAVRVKAAELGRPISEIIRALLEAWVAGEIQLPASTEEDGEKPPEE